MKPPIRNRFLRTALCCLLALGGALFAHGVTVPVVPKPVASYNTYPGYIRVTWKKVAGATQGYYVYRSTSSYWSTAVRLTSVSASTTGVNDFSVTTGKTYYYWVCPRYKSGSAYKYVANASRYAAGRAKSYTVPQPTASTTNKNFIKVSWTPNSASAPYGYYVFRGTSSTFSKSVRIASVGKTTATYSDYKASTGRFYYYWVCPRLTSSKYAYNTSRYDWGWRGTAPAVPKPVASTSYTDYVKVTWKKSSGAKYGYYIYRSTSSGSSGWSSRKLIGTASSASTTFYDYSGLPATKYYYWVCPRHLKNGTTYAFTYNTSKSDWGKRTGVVPKPSCTVGNPYYIKVTWPVSADATYGYYIFRSTSPNWAYRVHLGSVSSKSTTSFFDKSAISGVKYYYWICPRLTSSGIYLNNTTKYNWGRRN